MLPTKNILIIPAKEKVAVTVAFFKSIIHVYLIIAQQFNGDSPHFQPLNLIVMQASRTLRVAIIYPDFPIEPLNYFIHSLQKIAASYESNH